MNVVQMAMVTVKGQGQGQPHNSSFWTKFQQCHQNLISPVMRVRHYYHKLNSFWGLQMAETSKNCGVRPWCHTLNGLHRTLILLRSVGHLCENGIFCQRNAF
jgi:hypothetical protein